MPAQYDSIKATLAKRSGGSPADASVKSSAARIFIARGKGGNRSGRAKSLQADRKTSR